MKSRNILYGFTNDLLSWEMEYLSSFLSSLEETVQIKPIPYQIESSVTFKVELPKEPLWVFTRDWRAATNRYLKNFDGHCYLSVLGLKRAPNSFLKLVIEAFQPRIWRQARILTHSPLLERFFAELEKSLIEPPMDLALPLIPTSSWTRNMPDSNGPITIGTASYLSSDSNIHYFLTVAHYLYRKRPDLRFVILGDGPFREHVKTQISQMQLDGVVEVRPTGHAKLDLLLYVPAANEHFIPLLMAAAQEIPVLSADVLGIERFISDGVDGFIVPTHDTKAMGELVLRFVDNRDLALGFADRLKKKLSQAYAPEKIGLEYRKKLLGEVVVNEPSRTLAA